MRVADDEHERPSRRVGVQLVERLRDQRRLVDHHDVDLADAAARSQSANASCCAGVSGVRLEAVAVVLRRPALERVRVAGDAHAGDLVDHGPVAAAALEPAELGQHDRAVVGQLLRRAVGVVVAGDEHERPADLRHARGRATSRAASRGPTRSPAKNTGPSPAARSRIGSEIDVVVQVRGDRDPRRALDRRAARRGRDEPREADELRVELLVERAAGAPHGRDGVERARDVGAVGVVLRLGRSPRAAGAARRGDHADRGRRQGRGQRPCSAASGRRGCGPRTRSAGRAPARRAVTTPISARR